MKQKKLEQKFTKKKAIYDYLTEQNKITSKQSKHLNKLMNYMIIY